MSEVEETSAAAAGEDEPRGQVDLTSVLYVVGGVPVIALFLVGLFTLVGACDQMNIRIPA
jgi:hypothetical protein